MTKKVSCFVCNGWKYVLSGDRDPIEGSKMQSRIPCTFCNASGHITSDDVRFDAVTAYQDKLYETFAAREAAEQAKAAHEKELWKSIVRKLTLEELKLIDYNEPEGEA